MRRYYLNEKLHLDDLVVLKGEIFHHIFDVCRQQVGHKFELMTEDGNAFLSQVTEIKKKEAVVQIQGCRALPKPKRPFINLILSIPKISTFESILEKAVELGVNSIQPMISDYSFLKSIKHYPADKKSRWDKIILQATQQSARGNILVLQEPKEFHQICTRSPWRDLNAIGIFAFEGECQNSFKNYLQSKRGIDSLSLEDIWVVIGSEGGFSEKEVNMLKQLDLEPVTLGEQVLRVETACLSIVSSLKYEFDLL
jgi:16S rRNA (uracil1498-N3)-methyltransferase